MEFFEIADVLTSQEEIRSKVSIDNLTLFCAAVEAVDEPDDLGRVVFFRHWGRFHLRLEEVMGGVRFSVPDCPNALTWTVTTGYPPAQDKIVLHATINRTGHDADFIAAARDLLVALKIGLESNFVDESNRSGPHPFGIPCL